MRKGFSGKSVSRGCRWTKCAQLKREYPGVFGEVITCGVARNAPPVRISSSCPTHSGAVAECAEGAASAWSAGIAAVQGAALTKWDWATLLQRVWDVDALNCEGCGGRMKFIAVIKDRAVIERILRHIGEDAQEPRFARVRDPCDAWA